MNRKIVIALTVPMIVGIICLSFVSALTPTNRINAETRLSRRILESSGDHSKR